MNKMIYYKAIFFFTAIILGTNAFGADTSTNPVKNIDDTRIETVNEHAFFILTLPKAGISYGDRVELVFGLNHKIEGYNISGKDIHTFTNSEELVVSIAPEDLRCFKKKTLRKVNIYTEGQTVDVKTNIGKDHLKINEY